MKNGRPAHISQMTCRKSEQAASRVSTGIFGDLEDRLKKRPEIRLAPDGWSILTAKDDMLASPLIPAAVILM